LSLTQTDISEFAKVITLDDAKRQAYQSTENNDTDLNAILMSLIESAVLSCENYTWLQIVKATYEYRLDEFPEGILDLPRPPVTEVKSVKYVTADGEQELSDTKYRVDLNSHPARIEPVAGWPGVKNQLAAVTVTFSCGYGADVPGPLKTGMLMLIKYLYENRDAVAISNSLAVHELPFGVKWMWDPYSLRRFT